MCPSAKKNGLLKPKRSFCGARNRNGKGTCTQPAGWGTTHVGVGACKYHLGSTSVATARAHEMARERALERDVDKPYDELIHEKDIAELLRILKQRTDVTDLTEDLQLARAVTLDFVNRARQLETALLRWSASWDKDWQASAAMMVEELQIAQAEEDWLRYSVLLEQVPDPLRFLDRPKKVVDVSQAVRMFKDIAEIVTKIVAMQQHGSIPVRDVEVLLVEIASSTERTIRRELGDDPARHRLVEAVQRAWAALRLQSWDSDLLDPGDAERAGAGVGALN